MSYVALYGEINSGLITIKTRAWKNRGGERDCDIDNYLSLSDDTDSPEDFVQSMRSNLTDSNNGKLLLCAVWTTDTARRKFDMYPECIGQDDTEETNNEEHPLYLMTAFDGDFLSFPFLWSFIAAKTIWKYVWINRHGAPILFPGTALHHVEKVVTDACPRETAALESLVGKKMAVEFHLKIVLQLWTKYLSKPSMATAGSTTPAATTKMIQSTSLFWQQRS